MSIAAQLQAIKSAVRGGAEPSRKPSIRPSILLDPKSAADIDLRTIHENSLPGLEALIDKDARFAGYRNTLFSQTSLDLDREKMTPAEERKLDASIRSYLLLLSGYLQEPAALRTIEYLLRRYQVHLFNVDELVLCALPYHDTHFFVRIVQLLDLGNRKWTFLEGVKESGAPPPRSVIVQQCIRDKGVLQTICDYAIPTKGFQHSGPVISFCTAVVIETLGSIPKLDTDTVNSVQDFVFKGLNHKIKGCHDHKAGALMVVGLLATRATLMSKLVQNLVFVIAKVAEHDSKQSADLPWLRVLVMAIVSLAQSQSAEMFTKKTVLSLNNIRDFVGILYGLSQEFNIQRFLCLYLQALVEYSESEDSCHLALISTIDTLPLKEHVAMIVSKVLSYCMNLSKKVDNPHLHEAGEQAQKILLLIDKHYTCELRGSVRKFLENSKVDFRKDDSAFRTFCLMFDGSLGIPLEISDSRLLFSLEHPKADVRQAALSKIAASNAVKDMATNPKRLIDAQDAIIRRLHDDDLSVVEAALSINGLTGILDPSRLFRSYCDVFFRCIDVIHKSTSKAPKASDMAVLCIERLAKELPSRHLIYYKEVATIMFPLLLVLPKTLKVNLKALELADHIQIPLYHDISLAHDSVHFEQIKSGSDAPQSSQAAAAINTRTIGALAKNFLKNPEEHIHWLIKCSNRSDLSKNLFLLIILQALIVENEDSTCLFKLYKACSHTIKLEWEQMESRGSVDLAEKEIVETLDKSSTEFVNQLLSSDSESLSLKIIICIYWHFLKKCAKILNQDTPAATNTLPTMLDEMLQFFANSPSRNVYRKHLDFLQKNCTRVPFHFLSKYFAEEGYTPEVQIESLNWFRIICSTCATFERSNTEENHCLQFLLGFPSLLIPLANENKDVRVAALNCIKGLHKQWQHFDMSRLENGSDISLTPISTPAFVDFLEALFSQTMMISSDIDFLPSYLASLLGPSCSGLLIPENIHKRFDQSAKDAILNFILGSSIEFSSYGKLKVLSLFRRTGNSLLLAKGVESLLFELLERRNHHHLALDKSYQELSAIEIKILCILLEACFPTSSTVPIDPDTYLIQTIKVGGPSDDQAVIQPCLTVLRNLTSTLYDSLKTEIQDEIFGNLVSLFRNDNGDIRDAAKDALIRINITAKTIVRFIQLILSLDGCGGSFKRMKLEKFLMHQNSSLHQETEENALSFLGSLLNILLLGKDIADRSSLLQPLFEVLEKLFSNDWLQLLVGEGDVGTGGISDFPEAVMGAISYAQQTTLLILKDITDQLKSKRLLKDEYYKFNMNLLVNCARYTLDVGTRNHVFMLLSSVARISSEWTFEHIIDIFSLIGESAVKQVLEDLISTLVPCWLSKTSSTGELFKIFIKALPEVTEYRRLTLMVSLLRTLGEKSSLGLFIVHLFRSLIQRTNESSECGRRLSLSSIMGEWEFVFALQLFNQYSYKMWFPCLVDILQEIVNDQEEVFSELQLAVKFILHELQDTELVFGLESAQDNDQLQVTLGALMEQFVSQFELVSVKRKHFGITKDVIRELKGCINEVLEYITRWMVPSAYFKCIIQLLGHPVVNVKRKALGLLCETMKDHSTVNKNHKKSRIHKRKSSAFAEIDETVAPFFNEVCLKMVELIDNATDDSNIPVKLSAISSLEVLTSTFRSDNMIFSTCLECVVKHIGNTNLALSAGCLRATGTLIAVLGSKALSQLPYVMKNLLERAHEISDCPIGKSRLKNEEVLGGLSTYRIPLLVSVLTTLEAVIENLGGFLNPYLDDILDLVILHPEFALVEDTTLKLKVSIVRRLITQKIPVRLILGPLIKLYSNALKCGESSLSLTFEVLADLIGAMDRSSVGSYHVKVYEQCLVALDLRRQLPESVKNISIVEQSVIHAMIVLTMKLTETMFRPLFFHSLEWAESELEDVESKSSRSIDRVISFYELVNKLIEQHRSLFVPYFKYLVDGFTHYLAGDFEAESIPLAKKRKKVKFGGDDTVADNKVGLSPKKWHLRALVLKALYRCFLYDTTDLKFLDASTFQVLLKPIACQLVVDPPELSVGIPSVEEVDGTLVLCLGQMAVTTRSDVLWKPLNHEVLMHTRSEKIRAKMLGLKVVKYLVEQLKEEYLVFLPETIPFLGELLEDVELPVKTLAQDILKEMETLSGESLRQYL